MPAQISPNVQSVRYKTQLARSQEVNQPIDFVFVSHSNIMPTHPSPAVQLNNYLQARGELDRITWVFKDSGPQNSKIWHATVKYDGTVIGEGTSSNKNPAKDEAARKALQALQSRGG